MYLCVLCIEMHVSEPYIIFSGGTPSDPRMTTVPSLTVMKGNNMTVLEMEHEVVDFVTLSSTPWNSGTSTSPVFDSGMMQNPAYHASVRVPDVTDLKQRLIDARCKALWTMLLMNGIRDFRPLCMKNILNTCCDIQA